MTFFAMIVLAASATFTRPMERVSSIDPLHSQSVYDSSVLHLIYCTPLEVDYTVRPYKLKAGLCALPEVSADGRVYRFRLIPSRAAALGLSAQDIVDSLARVRDPANVSPGGWTLKEVESMRAIENNTVVEIKLRKRLHVFPWMMAMSYACVRRADGSGTGPFELTSWRKNHEMVFQRREKSADGFDTVRYLTITDPSTQWLMFLKGEIDLLADLSRDYWDAVVDASGALDPRLAEKGVRLYSEPTLTIHYIGFNMNDPVLKNKKLRQALTCAFDFDTWKKFYHNRIERANGPVPPGIDGALLAPSPYAFDLARAKKLLAEAGYPEGRDPATGRRLVIELAIGRASQESREAGELLASFFAKIGVKLELSFSTWNAFLRSVNESRVQLYLMGWVGDYPDAENFLQLFHSQNKSPGANHSNFDNAEFDAAFNCAMAAETDDARNQYWQKCQEIIREECPWIFTHFPKKSALVRARVQNYAPGDFSYGHEKDLKVGDEKK